MAKGKKKWRIVFPLFSYMGCGRAGGVENGGP